MHPTLVSAIYSTHNACQRMNITVAFAQQLENMYSYFTWQKGQQKQGRPCLVALSQWKVREKESHSSFLIPLYAQHNIKLLQSLQTITDQKTNCLLVFLIPIPFHFRPDCLFQISCNPKQWNHIYHLKWHSHSQTAKSCTCDAKFITTYIHTGNSVHQSKTGWPVQQLQISSFLGPLACVWTRKHCKPNTAQRSNKTETW